MSEEVNTKETDCPFTREPCMEKRCRLWVETKVPNQMGVPKTIETCVFLAQYLKPPILLMGQQPQGMPVFPR